MYIDIYQSNKNNKKFIVVPSGSILEVKNFGPEAIDFISFMPFITKFSLGFGIIGLNVDEARSNLLRKGFHIFL